MNFAVNARHAHSGCFYSRKQSLCRGTLEAIMLMAYTTHPCCEIESDSLHASIF